MRKALGLIGLLVSACAYAQTVTNGSFEADPAVPTGWAEYGYGATGDPDNHARVYVAPAFGILQAKEGTNAYGCVPPFEPAVGGLRQVISGFTPGVDYAFTVWVFTPHVGPGVIRIGVNPAGGFNPEAPENVFLPHSQSRGTWGRLAIGFVPTSLTSTVFLEYVIPQTSNGYVYFDQVELHREPDFQSHCIEGFQGEVSLADCQVGVDEGPEAFFDAPPGYVITGVGFRSGFDDVTTMRIEIRELLPDGTLGNPIEKRTGVDPAHSLEVNITLPPCYLMVGLGARAAYETDITTMAVWARPLLPDGTLGPMEEFRTGSEPNEGLEKQFQASGNRVMTGMGLRTLKGNVAGLYARTCELKSTTENIASHVTVR